LPALRLWRRKRRQTQWQHARRSRKGRRPRQAAKRELIDTGSNKLYVRRNKRGTFFKEFEDVGRSLAQDRRRKAKTVAKRGQGIGVTANGSHNVKDDMERTACAIHTLSGRGVTA
jgi:hypothetical protein